MNRWRGIGADDGFAMVLVIGTAALLTALMVLATTTAGRSLVFSRKHVSFEQALAAAESGVDAALARAQKAYDDSGTDSYAMPSPTDPSCARTAVAWPWPGSTPTEAEERAWAVQQLEGLAGCRTTGGPGEYVFLKPTGHNAVYAMGWSPKLGAAEMKRRVLKSEYLFTPYSPSNAILSRGNLSIDASTTVTSALPADRALASVHSNGTVSVSNGNPTVYGSVTQAGPGSLAQSNNFYGSAGTATRVPATHVPNISARQVWGLNHASSPPGGWWDLCPDGTVRSPDGAGPCDGTLVGTNAWRGWEFSATAPVRTWVATSAVKQTPYSGTYYVHGGDAAVRAGNAGSDVPNLTVIASSLSTGCAKVGGNIDWNQIDIAAPSVPSTFMVADQDLRTGSSFRAGSATGSTVVSGFFLAGDQLEMSTSSAGAYGAVVSGDECDPADGQTLVDANVVKNPSIYYDPTSSPAIADVVNTTLWLEYPAG